MAVYGQLASAPLCASERAEVEAELQVLQLKLEDADIGMLQALRSHLDAAKQTFFTSQFTAAAEEYTLAYALKCLPRLLFNSAQAYRRAGRADLAYLLYQRFLEEDATSPLKKEVSAYLSELGPLAFRPPLYKRAWFWGVGGGAVALVAVGVGVGVSVARAAGYPNTDGPTYDISFGAAGGSR